MGRDRGSFGPVVGGVGGGVVGRGSAAGGRESSFQRNPLVGRLGRKALRL